MTPRRRPFGAGYREDASADPVESGYESTVLSLLLQEHRASQTTLLVLDTLGRLMSAGLVIYLGLVSELSTMQIVSGLLVAMLIAAFWSWGRHRALRAVRSVEETLSRMSGGSAEQAYIESRFIAESGRGPIDSVMQIEPGVWLCVTLIVVLLSAIVGGVTS